MTIIIKILIFFNTLLIVLGTSNTIAGSIAPELTNLLAAQNSNGNVDIIIEFTDSVNLPLAANLSVAGTVTREELIRSLVDSSNISQVDVKSTLGLNGISAKSIWLNNSVAASVPENLISQISQLQNVALVKIDKKFVLEEGSQGSKPTQLDWNITSIGANTVWNTGIRGEGVLIGSMDTGVDVNHPDLSTRWRGGSNSWFDPYGVHVTPYDSNGHGTQTTSLIVGGDASGNTIGVAPDAEWIAAKIFDDSGMASISAIHLAFQWMLDPDGNPNTDDGADIINNSWNFGSSFNQCDFEFQDDISILRSADVAVVFSAGNSGPSPATSHSPANNEDTISVGATNESQNVAFFSSRGPSACDDGAIYPNLAAPGVNVLTADLTFGGVIPNSYTYSSGTSFSAPHISGALALLQSIYPSSSLGDRETALYDTAVLTGGVDDYGYGIISIDAAVQYMRNEFFVAKLNSPIGNIGENNILTYSWNAVTSAADYRLLVVDPAGNHLIDEEHSATSLACSTECSLLSATSLPDGSYWWSIQARNSMGSGPWSTFTQFSVGSDSVPATATLVSPIANFGVDPDTYTWNVVTNATDYRLLVVDPAGNHLIDEELLATSLACTTECSVLSATSLPDGSYWWSIQAKNSMGSGSWSTFTQLSVGSGSVPTAATLISPIANLGVNPDIYTWNVVTSATDYRLLVVDPAGNHLIDEEHSATSLACSTECSLLSATSLPDGSYWWSIQAKNSMGSGPWSSFIQFSKSSTTN